MTSIRIAPFAALGAALVLVAPSDAQEPAAVRIESRVRDGARLFGADTVRQADRELEEIERGSKIPVVIETVDSLRGAAINDAALEHARDSGGHGVFILISRRDKEISRPFVRRPFEDRLPEAKRAAIRQAFLEGFNRGDFDAGLKGGIAALGRALGTTGGPDAPAGDSNSKLIERNRARLTLAGARRVLAAAEAKAADMRVNQNIAIVDDGGHLLAFARMDGARPASVATALTKAITAATFRQETGPLPPGGKAPDVLLNLSLQNAAAASGGKLTTLKGGLPIVIDGQVIGAVGVGGGTGEQDLEVAKAGVAALLDDLKHAEADAKARPEDDGGRFDALRAGPKPEK